ncbi:hypothetical protein KAT80_01795 [Candidatus Pacearchaeota archaeon]|nr:hypothetical protein [Candidatus Pacearchaeota archaeon]
MNTIDNQAIEPESRNWMSKRVRSLLFKACLATTIVYSITVLPINYLIAKDGLNGNKTPSEIEIKLYDKEIMFNPNMPRQYCEIVHKMIIDNSIAKGGRNIAYFFHGEK